VMAARVSNDVIESRSCSVACPAKPTSSTRG
jgi:hypothetical protein